MSRLLSLRNDLDKIAERIGVPVAKWAGRCKEISDLFVSEKIVRGKSVYGFYHGFIHPDSIFGERAFTHHGWVQCKCIGSIVDPTRWVFEKTLPYIYIGPEDNPEYDFGGNLVRKMFMRPPPEFSPTQRSCWVPLSILPAVEVFYLPKGTDETVVLCYEQIAWIASLPLDALGDYAYAVFRWVVDEVKMPGFIPIDNREAVLGPIRKKRKR